MKINKTHIVVTLIWLALAWLVYTLMDDILNPNKLESLGEQNTVTLQRGNDGHYRAEALINGQKFNVLVDTGATGVAISQAMAEQLALNSHIASRTSTANGDTVSYLIRLDSIQIGGVTAKDVSASIVPGLEGDALLGMSFLGRMDVRLYHGQMTIKQLEP